MNQLFRFAKSSLAAISTALLLCAGASASVLTAKANVDNGYSIFISTSDTVAGTYIGGGTDWTNTSVQTATLDAGTNYYLHIYAYDTGGIAGFLGGFSLAGTDHHFANGGNSLLTGAAYWSASQTGFGSSGPLTDLGVNGVGPWGYQPAINPNAHWIWAGDAQANDFSYFSAQILAAPPASVPEPASLGMLGLGLLGMATLRRKATKRDAA